jgi:hypothetical protein
VIEADWQLTFAVQMTIIMTHAYPQGRSSMAAQVGLVATNLGLPMAVDTLIEQLTEVLGSALCFHPSKLPFIWLNFCSLPGDTAEMLRENK